MIQLEESGQWYNCTHKNESYCQYTFLYREGAGDQGGVQVVMDPDSVRCPPPYNPDYLGWIMGKRGGKQIIKVSVILFLCIMTSY